MSLNSGLGAYDKAVVMDKDTGEIIGKSSRGWTGPPVTALLVLMPGITSVFFLFF